MDKYPNKKEQSPTYFVICGAICAVLPLPAFWVAYLCLKFGERWPLIWVAIFVALSWISSYNLFRTARGIKEIKKGPTNETER
jgi:MFS-type transporter involved in bile tolerance (Atg22 family)